MSPELLLAGAIGVALSLYFRFGGADFGGAVWDLLASGPRAAGQRRAIAAAIGPVWEANHVWLILVIVMLFTGFPPAFAAISVALHVPLTLFLIGVVLRGSAFAFRALDLSGDRSQQRYGRVFSMASTIAPALLGAIVGALVSGNIRVRGGIVTSSFFAPWLAPFPLAVGVFALALCALLAATYLTVETSDPALREDFRRRALAAGVAVGLCALGAALAVGSRAPAFRRALVESWWSWPLQIATGGAAVGAFSALWRRRFRVARACAGAQVCLILVGWGLAQYPYLIAPDLTLARAAAPEPTLRLLLWAIALGAVTLFPSLAWLYRVFKSRP